MHPTHASFESHSRALPDKSHDAIYATISGGGGLTLHYGWTAASFLQTTVLKLDAGDGPRWLQCRYEDIRAPPDTDEWVQ
jgi:hypothetical protein